MGRERRTGAGTVHESGPREVARVRVGARVAACFLRQFSNWREIWMAYRSGRPLPPFILRNGFVIQHTIDDAPLRTFRAIFEKEIYTSHGFYAPEPGDTVLDIGANVGFFAMYITRKEPNARVFCFEPSAETRRRLDRNILVNRLEDTVRSYPFALGARDGESCFFETAATVRRSLYPEAASAEGDSSVTLVPCIRLETAIELTGEPLIDFLKLSVEGAEAPILEAADRFVFNRVRKIAVAFQERKAPGSCSRIMSALRNADYPLIRMTPDHPGAGSGLILASR